MKRKLISFNVGKWVPTIARKIDSENPTADLKINLKGVGIGDGFMSPPDSAIYGDELYQGIQCTTGYLYKGNKVPIILDGFD